MKLKVSLSVKFTLLAILALILLTSILTDSNYKDQQNYFREKLEQQIYLYSQTLNANFGNTSILTNENKTTEIIDDFMRNNPQILSINILLFDKNYTLRIFDSNNKEKIGTISNHTSLIISCIVRPNPCFFFKRLGNSYKYLSIMPIYSAEQQGVIGAYELIVSMEKDLKKQEIRLNNIIQMSLVFLITAVTILLILIRYIIQKPISNLRKAANLIGKGNLDVRVNIKSRDEIGELASAFNKMAEELKESQNKIKEYNRILEKLLDQKDEFIGQLGHDLKNPLQSLVGLLPILLKEEKDPEKKEILDVMNHDVEYMQNLIFDTLKLARLRTDKIEFNFEKVNLNEVVDQVIKTLKPALNKNKIKIEKNIDKTIFVWADSLRLSEVFNNIISNSIKYSKGKRGKITINAEKTKNKIKVSIQDRGIGMTQDQLKKVFDEFYTADKSLSEHHSTGLGLAICKRIIEKHGGKIWVESPGIGKGSTFYFTLKSYDKI